MADIITQIGNSIIHHGKENDRIYLMKLSEKDMPHILDELESLAKDNHYSKIFAKIPDYYKETFVNKGYDIEAYIPDFYCGEKSAYFMSNYINESRKIEPDICELENVLTVAKNKSITTDYSLGEGFHCREAKIKDVDDMTALYKKVFETYPFPIHDNEYLIKTMGENIIYFGIWNENKLIALSSSEMDEAAQNVEMTDFAVDFDYRGIDLSIALLHYMETAMMKRNMKVLYTIARAKSYGMNITFSKLGYSFTGRLKNNTQICGNIESMNIWYKRLL